MERFSLEVKVGIVVTIAVGLVLAFIFILGDWNPFTNTYKITVTLDYAGGIKPGSDVHLAGAKVGKVDSIKFLSASEPSQNQPVLGLELLIDKRAKELIREDSTFSVYMESLLGGKIVEISPGSPESQVLAENAVVRGLDPPKLDSILNQAVEMLDGVRSIMDSLDKEDRENFQKLLVSLAKFEPSDVEQIRRLINNLADTSEDLKKISSELRPELKPLLKEVRGTMYQADNTLRKANSLLAKIDDLTKELGAMGPDDSEDAKEKVKELISAAEDLAELADRLNRFTEYVETEYSDIDRAELERIIRQFLQQEGVTINVGTIVKEPPGDYPPPPPPPEKSETNEKE